MLLKYQFPAVKGNQAGKEYYICMVPLGLLSKIFISDNGDVAPEHRAQRKLNELRIPEIKEYILNNRDSYVFSALAASIDGDANFVPMQDGAQVGVLEVDMDASFLINDGQHRKAAIDAALAEDETLKNETISVVMYKDQGLQRSQQMFTDLNKHAVTTSKSLNTLYESKDSTALITKNVINVLTKPLKTILLENGDSLGYDLEYKNSTCEKEEIDIIPLGYYEGMIEEDLVVGKRCMNHSFIRHINNTSFFLKIFPIHDKIINDNYYKKFMSYQNIKKVYISSYGTNISKVNQKIFTRSKQIRKRKRSH